MVPAVVIAGTQSGVGKTSITLGTVAALVRRGLRVQSYKVGPDYLDPTYLAIASGRPCYNLDGWMTGETYIRDLVARTAADADVAVIEGVMGLFDGAEPAGLAGSTAEIALWLGAPVVLVVNAHGAGRSLAATVQGFTHFLPEIRLAGVVANRCGSERHADGLRESLGAAALPPLVGAIRRGGLPELPSRHLGLVSADDRRFSPAVVGRLADGVEAGIDLDRLLALAGRPSAPAGPDPLPVRPQATARLGVARDDAFHFYYPDNLDALRASGCEIVPFSPLHDPALPSGLDGIYIGGGYPEEFARQLSANSPMLQAVREFAGTGRAVYAECGGLMYLSQGIELLDGSRHQMAALLPDWTRMCPQRKSLGYVEATLRHDGLWGPAGSTLRGHEFHYSEIVPSPGREIPHAYNLRYRRADQPVADGYLSGNLLASYAHLHFASRPDAVRHFVHILQSHRP